MPIVRRSFLLGVLSATLLGQELRVRIDGDHLTVSAPRLHFLTGKPLDQMRNGAAVGFDFQLMVLDDSRSVLRRSFERFVVSYDLWEERFSVTRVRGARAYVSRLTAPAAEAWCVDGISLLSSGLPDDKSVWVRLDIKAQEGGRAAAPPASDDGLSISSLIDVFSRVTKQQDPQHWRVEAGPIRLRELRKVNGRTGS